jgi:ADP-heptose:LPS heptosyltransferase
LTGSDFVDRGFGDRDFVSDRAHMNPRPLIWRCGALGDMVLVTPLIRALHRRFGQPVDLVSSGAWTRPLLEGQPGLGEIFLINSRKTPYWLSLSQQSLVKQLRARGPGPVWFCDIGAHMGRDLLQRASIPDDLICQHSSTEWVPGEHIVDRWIRFGMLSPPALADTQQGIANAGDAPRAAMLEIKPQMRSALEPWLVRRKLSGRPLILFQAGNKRTMRRGARNRVSNTKYWPEQNWADVIRAIRAERPDHAMLLLGVPAEHELNEEIAQLTGIPDVYNVANDLPIHILLPLLEKADSMVSVDTGPAHAAAALGCPTVTLFGTHDPSLCRPGGVTTPAITLTGLVDGKPNMLGIQVSEVVDAWKKLQSARR